MSLCADESNLCLRVNLGANESIIDYLGAS